MAPDVPWSRYVLQISQQSFASQKTRDVLSGLARVFCALFFNA